MTKYPLQVHMVNVILLQETSNKVFQLMIFFWVTLEILEHKNQNQKFSPKNMNLKKK